MPTKEDAMDRQSSPRVCIIGAGPYGVSVAAHLQSIGMDFRIFGVSMQRWRAQMPARMFLKSEGCASNLADPAGHHTLGRFCAEEGLPYGDRGEPVSRDTFARYAVSFQQNLVSDLEDTMVVGVRKLRDTFELTLSSGEKLNTQSVVIATGLERMAYTPPEFGQLPAHLRSHSADHFDLSGFKGKDVTVIGGGQSALETAALLNEEGVSVRLVLRKSSLAWNPVPKLTHRSLYQRLRHPQTNLGDGLQLWLYANAPWLFHHLPQRIRLERVKAVLGPAGAWWLKERIMGRLPIMSNHFVRSSEVRGDRAVLHLSDHAGRPDEVTTDHVIAATGYQFQIGRVSYLDKELKSSIRHVQQVPMLSTNFESSIPGLYFTGLASTLTFGPVMRFLCGASYTAQSISNHLATERHSYH
jgi:cation diffusion facilitator CzcD-associated flavoprotein CzcO